MLPPEYLEGLPDPILELYAQIEDEILRDMARRIATYDYWIPAADWQNQKLKEAGRLQEDILRILAAYSGKTEAELRDLMQQATTEGLRSDIAVYEAHGETVPPINESQPLVDTLNAGYRATRQTMRNLTRTTARTATQQFERELDAAWLQVSSGAFSTEQATRHAVKRLAARGVEAIRYSSGHTDTLEVAVRRAVVTGVNKTTLELQDKLADEVGCELVEVTAHAGARPSHAEWQGKIFCRTGTNPKYPSLEEGTGYGTGAGLGGWNCRHSFHPWFEGSPRTWTDEQLEKLKDKTVTYNGEKLTEYEASQKQRYIEQQIRKWKREAEALEAAGLDPSEANAKVRQWQATMRDFTQQTGLKRQYDREQISSGAVKNTPAPVANSVKSGIIAGGITGGLDPYSTEAQVHADQYYESVRHMTSDVGHIAANTGYSIEDISAVKRYVFTDVHDLGDDEPRRFDTSYEMAQSWQRLIDGKDIKPHDITLLKHEMLEMQLVDSGLSQAEAHLSAAQKYNYGKEAAEFYGTIKKNREK